MASYRGNTQTARSRFTLGQRVELTRLGESVVLRRRRLRGPFNANTQGTVMGFGRDSTIVRVRRDGARAVEAYHSDFWRTARCAPPPTIPIVNAPLSGYSLSEVRDG